MRYTTLIPEPEFGVERNHFQRLARLEGPAGTYAVWWWREQSKVLLCDPEDTFYIQDNLTIGQSLADILRCAQVALSDVRYFKHADFALSAVVSLPRDILDTEWSMLANDRYTIRATMSVVLETLPEPEAPITIERLDDDCDREDRDVRRRYRYHHIFTDM
jgi:hypothetical protein